MTDNLHLMASYSTKEELIDFQEEYGVVIPLPLLQEAFTHPSYKTIDENVKTYEQLETLGDTVLDLLVTKQLIEEDPDINPGELTKTRSAMVKNSSLSKLGHELGIDILLRISEAYQIGSRDIANAVEALFGAIYLNSGILACEAFYNQIKSLLRQISEELGDGNDLYYNPIGRLQEFTQKRQLPLPQYELIEQSGPDHDPLFRVQVTLTIENENLIDEGVGPSKKSARGVAASKLLEELTRIGLLK